VVAHEKVIFGSMDGKLYILTLKDGKEVVSYEVGEPISSTPAVLDGRILVSCEDGNIYSFISETGK
jgi:outer membrane protein assembly factor BamB